MSYKLLRSFYDGDTIVDDVSKLESVDAKVLEKALADGNVSEGGAEPSPEAPATDDPLVPEAPVVSGSPNDEVATPPVVDPATPPADPAQATADQIQNDLSIA